MPVRRDCRHYSTRTVGGDVVQRCRVGANEQAPFACPEHCLFFEPRSLSGGISVDPTAPGGSGGRPAAHRTPPRPPRRPGAAGAAGGE